MTSLAFGFGVLPLAIATGAGAGAQVAIGTSVLGGMLTGTFLAILFIPLFFVVVVQAVRAATGVTAPRRRGTAAGAPAARGGDADMTTPDSRDRGRAALWPAAR